MSLLLCSASWYDNVPRTKATTWYQSAQNASVRNALYACSDAGIVAATFTTPATGLILSPTGNTTVLDAAQLRFATTNREPVYLLVPGAPGSIYLADGETVDPSNTNISNLIAVFVANGLSATATAIAGYVSGKRVRVAADPYGVL